MLESVAKALAAGMRLLRAALFVGGAALVLLLWWRARDLRDPLVHARALALALGALGTLAWVSYAIEHVGSKPWFPSWPRSDEWIDLVASACVAGALFLAPAWLPHLLLRGTPEHLAWAGLAATAAGLLAAGMAMLSAAVSIFANSWDETLAVLLSVSVPIGAGAWLAWSVASAVRTLA